ncbi:MAG: hypothetical protein JWM19_4185 [Actinomycetia bacterium]|nr:hypothetical protein [Actinomycetes bacterium]
MRMPLSSRGSALRMAANLAARDFLSGRFSPGFAEEPGLLATLGGLPRGRRPQCEGRMVMDTVLHDAVTGMRGAHTDDTPPENLTQVCRS